MTPEEIFIPGRVFKTTIENYFHIGPKGSLVTVLKAPEKLPGAEGRFTARFSVLTDNGKIKDLYYGVNSGFASDPLMFLERII